ncbi:hypothetical protein BFP75_12325 [Maribacter sp. 4G9]|nr:hypothetical protein BFP75_12325 [Maribacter sp. 4G9]
MHSKTERPWSWVKGNRPKSIPMQSETAWAMRTKDLLDFKYPKISLAFLDTFSTMEKVSEPKSGPPRSTIAKHH